MENFVLFLENKIVGFIVGGIKGVYLRIDKGLMIVMQTKDQTWSMNTIWISLLNSHSKPRLWYPKKSSKEILIHFLVTPNRNSIQGKRIENDDEKRSRNIRKRSSFEHHHPDNFHKITNRIE
jgi:hypothetical protein